MPTYTLSFTRILGISLVIFVATLLYSLSKGATEIPLTIWWNYFLGNDISASQSFIIEEIRFPRSVTALLAGSGLAIAGLQMQTLFENPLAGPSVLGISSGATLGAALAMLGNGLITSTANFQQLSFIGGTTVIAASIAGSVGVMILMLLLSVKIKSNTGLLVAGILLSYFTVALVSILQYISTPDQVKEFLLWTFGSLQGVSKQQLPLLTSIVVIGILLAIGLSKSFNLLSLGEVYAKSMGLNTKRTKTAIILCTSILTGAITGYCGPIGFIGIAVPHLVRQLYRTGRHEQLLPLVAIAGSTVLLFCDGLSHIPERHLSIPINTITSLAGAPLVLWMILKKKSFSNA